MSDLNVQKRIIELRNELRAYKIATPLNYGALDSPTTVPSASWSGTFSGYYANISTGAGYIWQRWLAVFTRSDGNSVTPYVDFAFDYSSNGVVGERALTSYVYETGANSVTFAVELNDYAYNLTGSMTFSLTVQAISTINGTISLTTVY